MMKNQFSTEKFEHRREYAYFHRDLSPAERCYMANLKITEALALIEDEINIQEAYNQMDYSSINMSEYKEARKLLLKAMEHCKI